jgi:MoxR-like ATPase
MSDSTAQIARVQSTLNRILLGKAEQVRLALACLLAGGHLLLEDLPGVGKSTLSHALAKTLGLDYARVQGSNDLLPADILGYSLWNGQTQAMQFQAGPIFKQVLLMDELNRTPSKTQSALLEAMEEGQVSLDGQTHTLPKPFFVVATQNPLEQVGTFALPESQLDRFMMRLSLGLPNLASEKQLLSGGDTRSLIAGLVADCAAADVLRLQGQAKQVHASEALIDYVHRLLLASRARGSICRGLSPRAGLSLLSCARAHALILGRAHVSPDDVQAVFIAVAAHRLSASDAQTGQQIARELIQTTPIVA